MLESVNCLDLRVLSIHWSSKHYYNKYNSNNHLSYLSTSFYCEINTSQCTSTVNISSEKKIAHILTYKQSPIS